MVQVAALLFLESCCCCYYCYCTRSLSLEEEEVAQGWSCYYTKSNTTKYHRTPEPEEPASRRRSKQGHANRLEKDPAICSREESGARRGEVTKSGRQTRLLLIFAPNTSLRSPKNVVVVRGSGLSYPDLDSHAADLSPCLPLKSATKL